MSAKLVELIEVVELVGSGRSDSDPARMVTRWYTKTGEMVAERDRWKEQQAETTLNAEAIREMDVTMPTGDGDPAFSFKGDFKPGFTYKFQHFHYEAPRRDRE